MQELIYWSAKSVILLIQALPIELVARLGRIGGAIAFHLDARHRRVALENLAVTFSEKSAAEIRQIIREHFRRLGENYVSAVKTAGMSAVEIVSRCEIVGLERLKPPMMSRAGPGNRIVAIGHFGNFELYTTIARCVPGLEPASTFRGLRQPGLNRLLEELRNKSGCHFFERRGGLKEMMKALRREKILLGLLSDQNAGPKGIWGPFLGRECSTTPAPAVIALRYNAPLNTAVCYRTGLARWRIEIGPEIPLHENGQPRSLEAIMGEVNLVFEAAVRRDPANWFWVHRRWRAKPAPKMAPAPHASS
jgi:Kdo2-lipid IVA lauroyltransferase/acyltransferase